MCDPSASWSVTMARWRYGRRRALAASYVVAGCRPRMDIRLTSSALVSAALAGRSSTLSGLPRSGKTPLRSRPMTEKPVTTNALAESPSVTKRVHPSAPAAPSLSARSYLGTSRPSLPQLLSAALALLASARSCREARACRSGSSLAILAAADSIGGGWKPHLDAGVSSTSLDWLVKDGCVMRAWTKTETCSAMVATTAALAAEAPLPVASSGAASCRSTASSSVPVHRTPLTKQACTAGEAWSVTTTDRPTPRSTASPPPPSPPPPSPPPPSPDPPSPPPDPPPTALKDEAAPSFARLRTRARTGAACAASPWRRRRTPRRRCTAARRRRGRGAARGGATTPGPRRLRAAAWLRRGRSRAGSARSCGTSCRGTRCAWARRRRRRGRRSAARSTRPSSRRRSGPRTRARRS